MRFLASRFPSKNQTAAFGDEVGRGAQSRAARDARSTDT
jgi:hypothetical protein